MNLHPFDEILMLLAVAVLAVVLFQRWRLPSSLAYLAVGMAIGPHALGVISNLTAIHTLAEFGIVFLLFAIGLNFSLPQIHALRHLLFGLGTAQVLLTTFVVGLVAWLLGLPVAAAFVVGVVFAQSSTTIISKQLLDQGEADQRHGRLALAMSVFQDVTAVPFVVIIPVLAAAATMTIAAPLGWALLKAAFAFALVALAGRWLLQPLFHAVAARHSPELFTLTVLFSSLVAAWITQRLGLSMALGAFLAGMALGETEFRYHIEATIRPFRDVLLGLFFITIGMLCDPLTLVAIWPWALLGALILLGLKALLTTAILRLARIDARTAWRTGIVLAVGGEFGFALLALALEAGVLEPTIAQIALMAVLLSMIASPFLIRVNERLAARLARGRTDTRAANGHGLPVTLQRLRDHVIICGYGRIGQGVGQFLDAEGVPYLALDTNLVRVREARSAGRPVYFGDATQRDVLEAVGIAEARLLLVSFDQVEAAIQLLHHVTILRPDLPVMVRTRDETHVERLLAAGATEVVPETLEAALMIAAHVLLLVDVPLPRIARGVRALWTDRYRLLRELFHGEDHLLRPLEGRGEAASGAVVLRPEAIQPGQTLAELELDAAGVVVTAIVRHGQRFIVPLPQTTLEADDVLVLYGAPEDLERVRATLAPEDATAPISGLT